MIIENNLLKLLTSPKIVLERGLCHTQFYNPGDRLFSEGELLKGFFIIKSGKVDITKIIQENEKLRLFSLTSGDIAGEMAFGDEKNHFISAEIIEKTIVIFYEINKFEEFLKKNIEIALPIYLSITKIISTRLRFIDSNYKDFFTLSLKRNTNSDLNELSD
ncbi:Crp/Fnr family transcriptional regulator [Candidatus Poribacteria bacterium]|nr:Crp/Fnr family transcriptional regulator [Candidatus Poribacteria bacterium]